MNKDTIELLKKYRETKDEQIFKELVLNNLKFTKRIALNLSQKYGFPYEDLYQEGILVLMHFIRNCDPYKDPMCLYRKLYIKTKNRMIKYIAKNIGCINDYSHLLELTCRVLDYEKAESTSDLPKVTLDEIEIYKSLRNAIVYKGNIEESAVPVTLSEIYTGNEGELNVEREELKKALLILLNKLRAREEKVIRLRYGLDDGRFRTLDEIGKIFGGLTRQRIRQLEAKALSKLENMSKESYILKY